MLKSCYAINLTGHNLNDTFMALSPLINLSQQRHKFLLHLLLLNVGFLQRKERLISNPNTMNSAIYTPFPPPP